MVSRRRGVPAPLVSIVVDNFNYARFLGVAIESALAQTYPRVEVIVVDDGSTDGSGAVVASYGRQVDALFQANGGQASAFNAGFDRSVGDIVLFLDADDALEPSVVERVVEAFADVGVAKVQFRLALIDAAGEPTGDHVPVARREMPQGDVRDEVLGHGDDLPWPPTSGNAYAAWALDRVMPIPTGAYPTIGADMYLLNTVPLVGQVASLPAVGGSYRVHGDNLHHRGGFDVQQTRRTIELGLTTHALVADIAGRHGGATIEPGDVSRRSLTFLAHRMVSVRVEPARHPVQGDSRWRLAGRGIAAAAGRRDRPLLVRALYLAWFAAAAIVPAAAVPWMAHRIFRT